MLRRYLKGIAMMKKNSTDKQKYKEEYLKRKKERKEARSRKPKYGMLSGMKWMWLYTVRDSKLMAVCAIAVIPLALVLYALGLYTPSIILDKLQTGGSFNTVALVIVGLLAAHLIFRVIKDFIDLTREKMNLRILYRMRFDMSDKEQDLDHYLWLEEDIEKKQNRAEHAMYNTNTTFLHEIANMIVNVLCFFLFGSLVATLDLWILALIVVGVIINFVMEKWRQERVFALQPELDVYEKKHGYLTYNVTSEYQHGKDVRVYSLVTLIEKLVRDAANGRKRIYIRTSLATTVVNYVSNTVVALRDGLAYYILIQKALSGDIDASTFVLYFSAISQLSGFLNGILNQIAGLRDQSMYLSDYREFLDIYGKWNRGKGAQIPKGAFSVEFRNVSYTYPKGEKKVLDNVSFKINAGEKISLVGVNGAGKTTLTKLMCGLLLPDEGEILINGRNMLEYNRDEFYSLFSLVPQDYTLVPLTVAENITFCSRSEADDGRIWECLELAGLSEKVKGLPKGLDQPMMKRFDEDAVEFSGGETQRFLLARALYRNSPMLILDEPTAALDPIAEDEIYKKFDSLSGGKTAVFISHRLASTRFCDRIYLLDGASVAETGTHEELMKLGKKYAEMFEVQSQYYKETETAKEGGEEIA